MSLPPEFVRGSHEQAKSDLRLYRAIARSAQAAPADPIWIDIAVLRFRTLTSPSVN